MIAINQDSLGVQADRLKREIVAGGHKEIWGGRLSGNRFVLIFFNHSLSK